MKFNSSEEIGHAMAQRRYLDELIILNSGLVVDAKGGRSGEEISCVAGVEVHLTVTGEIQQHFVSTICFLIKNKSDKVCNGKFSFWVVLCLKGSLFCKTF